MRKFLAMAGLIAVAATACNKIGNESAPVIPEGEPANLTVKILGKTVGTKATEAGITRENAVNTVDILVFFDGGAYDRKTDAFGHFASTDPGIDWSTTIGGTVKASTGARIIYAIANSHMDLSGIETEAQLLALQPTLIADKDATSGSGLDNFVMIGRTSQTLNAGDNAVAINIDRVAARVRVKKITRNFASAALAGQTFVVEEMYLSNAVTKDTYADNVSGTGYVKYEPVVADFTTQQGVIPATNNYALWLNRPLGASGITLAQSASDVTVADESKYMYSFPNSVATDVDVTADPFAVQNTKLVIRAKLNGSTMYYVIPLGGAFSQNATTHAREYTAGPLKANYSYDFEEIVFTRPGSSDPNAQTLETNVNFTLTVNPWTLAPVETETGKFVI